MNPIDDQLLIQSSGSIAIVTFNRPKERNTLSTTILNRLDDALTELLQDQQLKAIVFTGSADVFLSGADINELTRLTPRTGRTFSKRGQQLCQRIADALPVTIAAINGFCMGGGLDFALACDIRLASAFAEFAHPGARLGIITGWGGTQRLPRLIGKSRALELFITARRFPSEEALRTGLITEIYDPVLVRAIELANDVIIPS